MSDGDPASSRAPRDGLDMLQLGRATHMMILTTVKWFASSLGWRAWLALAVCAAL